MDNSEGNGDKKGQGGINGDIRGEQPVLYCIIAKAVRRKENNLRRLFVYADVVEVINTRARRKEKEGRRTHERFIQNRQSKEHTR